MAGKWAAALPHDCLAKADPTSYSPPGGLAAPQAAGRNSGLSATLKRKRKSTQSFGDDDTPKAFTRLMQLHQTGKGPKGLDDGSGMPQGTKRKKSKAGAELVTQNKSEDNVELRILPGERLADFSARVNQALPIGGLVNKGRAVKGLEERRTKHEKKLRRMQEAWREEDARIKEREAEEKELAEEEEEDNKLLFSVKPPAATGPKKGRRSKGADDDDDDGEDPWAQLAREREQPKGLHDVAQEPPSFTKLPREKFKIRNGARADVGDVPSAAGSLRRREELGETRKSIIESYRKMMQGKRNQV